MLKKFRELLAWVDRQPNLWSAIGHGIVCTVWMTVGLLLALLSTVADNSIALYILVFFAGMCIGGYGLREIDNTLRGQPLEHGYEDFLGAILFSVAFSMIYAGILT